MTKIPPARRKMSSEEDQSVADLKDSLSLRPRGSESSSSRDPTRLPAESSDLTFVCNGIRFAVHKAVVCEQSPVITKAVTGNFEESRTNVITMDDFQPATVMQFVQFLYTGDYGIGFILGPETGVESHENGDEIDVTHLSEYESDNDSASDGSSAEQVATGKNSKLDTTRKILIQHVEMNSIGDYYDVNKLVSAANAKIESFFESHVKTDDTDQTYGSYGNQNTSYITPCTAVRALIPAIEAASSSTGDKQLMGFFSKTLAKLILSKSCGPNLEPMSHACADSKVEKLKGLSGIDSNFFIDVIRATADHSREKMRAMEKEHEELEDKFRVMERDYHRSRNAMRSMEPRKLCRSCNPGFGISLGQMMTFSQMIPRCTKCGLTIR